MAAQEPCDVGQPDYARRAAIGTLATLAGLMMLYGCERPETVEPAAQQAVAQETKEHAVDVDDGTAAGPGPVDTTPGSAPDHAGKEDPPQP